MECGAQFSLARTRTGQVSQVVTHPLTHSLTHSVTHSLTHSLTQSLGHSLTYSVSQSLSQSVNHFVELEHLSDLETCCAHFSLTHTKTEQVG